jgi:hypothetical protein
MVVRISGEDQFRLDGEGEAAVNELDKVALQAVERGDEPAFAAALQQLVQFVRERGTPLDADDLSPSDLIVPPADTTLQEAAENFTGEGWLPEGD